jgi:hypothetical protein
LNYEQKKQLERDLRKTSNLIKKSEERIEKLEKDIQEKDQILSKPELQENIDFNDVSIEYSTLTSDLEKEMVNWENLHAEIDRLQESK